MDMKRWHTFLCSTDQIGTPQPIVSVFLPLWSSSARFRSVCMYLRSCLFSQSLSVLSAKDTPSVFYKSLLHKLKAVKYRLILASITNSVWDWWKMTQWEKQKLKINFEWVVMCYALTAWFVLWKPGYLSNHSKINST